MKTLLVDKKIAHSSEMILKNLGFDLIKTTEVQTIDDVTSTHPDMQFLKVSDDFALVEASTYDYYKNLMPSYKLIPIFGIQSPYPFDCLLNVTCVNDKCFITCHQNDSIGKYFAGFTKVFVRQGYTKCNILVLNDEAILSSDVGIIKAAEKFGLRNYYLPADEIALQGYENGFWGGCGGLIGENNLFLNGNIECLDCFNDLMRIFEKEKIEPIYSKDIKLTDIGSILKLN